MRPIMFDTCSYRIDGKPAYLLSGEFHYFRVPKKDWRERMQLFKEAGGNCLATYVPWLLHEPEEGRFRFSGEDWLDLEGFLKTAQEEGLYVIARPGPYQYSELVYHGLPGWLVSQYPETLALNPAGKSIGYASFSYTHPLFLQKVRNWFAQICPILARYTLSKGGPIAFTQIDNELVGIHEWFGSLDYHPVTMGFGKEDGKYPAFLKSRYASLDALNAAYGTQYRGFVDANPTLVPQEGLTGTRIRKDYHDFYLSTIADYAQILVDYLREFGIDTPIVHNSGNPEMNANFQQVAERLGGQFLLGSDHYYTLGQDWAQNNPTPQYAARVFVSLEMLRLMGYPPTVFEMPGGSASNWPPITPSDALACYLTNLAFGMKGSNYYIFTGGPNPPEAGTTTDLYDYDASISAEGVVRPLYAAQAAFGAAAHQRSHLLSGKRLVDVRLGMDLEYARSESSWKAGPDWTFSSPEAWNFLRRGVLTTALCASLSPELVDLSSDAWTGDTSTPLVVACSASMARKTQERLVEFIRHGGKVLFTPILPSLDEAFEPCSLLKDLLGIERFEPDRRGISHPRVAGIPNVMGKIFWPEPIPQDVEILGEDTMDGRKFAFMKNFAGGGAALVLGLTWSHAMHEHERMILKVLQRLAVRPVVRCSTPNLWTSVISDGNHSTLFVLNLFTAPMQGDISVGDQAFGTMTIDPISVKLIDF